MARTMPTFVCTIDYVEWHDEAGRRHRRGERQKRCDLGLFYFPEWIEDRARHRDWHHGESCSALTTAVERASSTPEQ